jgi:hypothetical protein
MAPQRSRKLVFPADIHAIAADIRRQALQHPDRDPVVPRRAGSGAPRKQVKRAAAKRATPKRTKTAKTKRARRK